MKAKLALLAGATLVAAVSVSAAQDMSDEETIANATSAAPAAVGSNATVMNWEMKVLQEGSNGFTCFPDDPVTPSNDPMCVDENGLAWANALMTKAPPPADKMGFGYMLQGETAASNVDPFAAPPAEGEWSEAGPHVMIFNPGTAFAGYANPGEDPDPTQPFVMWAGTPYEHLMIPVE
jgi:hypothetical protein